MTLNAEMRVVVADDEADLRAFYERVVGMLGHRIVGVADSGIVLVELSTRFRPDLIITDIRMPGMNGLEAVRTIGGNSIVIIASADDPVDLAAELADRVVARLIKPFGLPKLQDAIRAAETQFGNEGLTSQSL